MSDTTVHIPLASDEMELIESVARIWGCSPEEAASSLLSTALEREVSSGRLKKMAEQQADDTEEVRQ